MSIGGADFEFDTHEDYRTLTFKKGDVSCSFRMDILPGLENITTVLPFKGFPDRYFMTTKQNCMPCEGTFTKGAQTWDFSKDDSIIICMSGRGDKDVAAIARYKGVELYE